MEYYLLNKKLKITKNNFTALISFIKELDGLSFRLLGIERAFLEILDSSYIQKNYEFERFTYS